MRRTRSDRKTTMMRVVLTGMSLVALAGIATPRGAHAQETDEAAVLQVVRDLFDGMRDKDEAKLRSVFHAEAQLHSAGRDREGNLRVASTEIDGFISGMVASQGYIDEVTFDEEVRIDADLAMAWTPYNLFVGDDFIHCGVDVFVMARTDDGWKILELTDTRRREGCDPERRG